VAEVIPETERLRAAITHLACEKVKGVVAIWREFTHDRWVFCWKEGERATTVHLPLTDLWMYGERWPEYVALLLYVARENGL
jgi:hypothetical protein